MDGGSLHTVSLETSASPLFALKSCRISDKNRVIVPVKVKRNSLKEDILYDAHGQNRGMHNVPSQDVAAIMQVVSKLKAAIEGCNQQPVWAYAGSAILYSIRYGLLQKYICVEQTTVMC